MKKEMYEIMDNMQDEIKKLRDMWIEIHEVVNSHLNPLEERKISEPLDYAAEMARDWIATAEYETFKEWNSEWRAKYFTGNIKRRKRHDNGFGINAILEDDD